MLSEFPAIFCRAACGRDHEHPRICRFGCSAKYLVHQRGACYMLQTSRRASRRCISTFVRLSLRFKTYTGLVLNSTSFSRHYFSNLNIALCQPCNMRFWILITLCLAYITSAAPVLEERSLCTLKCAIAQKACNVGCAGASNPTKKQECLHRCFTRKLACLLLCEANGAA